MSSFPQCDRRFLTTGEYDYRQALSSVFQYQRVAGSGGFNRAITIFRRQSYLLFAEYAHYRTMTRNFLIG
jgi:hypothetical protein